MRTLLLTLTTCLLVLPVQAKYSGGSGTAQDPYQIATAADLIALGNEPNDYDKHFILTADIDLDPNLPGRKVFDKAVIAPVQLNPWDEQETSFTGVFDGNSHRILNLMINGKEYLGLFGLLESAAEVKDLGLVDAEISASGDRAAALVGGFNFGGVSSCYGTGKVSGALGASGLVSSNSGLVTQCYSTCVVGGTWDVGGLVGDNGGTVAQCHSTGAVTGTGGVGGLVGSNGGTVTRCYTSGAVSGGQHVGGLVGDNYAVVIQSYSIGAVCSASDPYGGIGGLVGTNWGSVTGCYSSSPVTGAGWAVGGLVGGNEVGTVTMCFWDAETSGKVMSAGGTGLTTAQMQNTQTYLNAGWDWVGEMKNGTSETWQMPEGGGYPVLAVFSGYTPHQLQGTGTVLDPYLIHDALELGATVYYNPSAHYRLVAPIDLSGIRWGTAVIPSFSGTFDGNDLTISHLTITGGGYLGVFGILSGEVKDLAVVDVNITGSGGYVGGLVGYNCSKVAGCFSTGSVTAAGRGVGGLVGSNDFGIVTRCYSTAGVSGESSVGGLLGGNADGTVTECYSAGAVSGKEHVGGLVGSSEGPGVVMQCYSTSTVSGKDYVGGLVGSNCSGSGWLGGPDVSECYSTGRVSGTSLVGGLVGSNTCFWGDGCQGTDTACFWDIQTSGQAKSAGGIGKTTAQMQDIRTYQDVGWDFWGESEDGLHEIWLKRGAGVYPALAVFGGYTPPRLQGSGTPEDPYLISNAVELGAIVHCSPSAHYRLATSIDLLGIHWGTAVIPSLGGTFNGNGLTISHLTVTGNDDLGLFGILSGEVKDLGVVDVSITGSGSYVGGLVGENYGGTVIHCYSTGVVSSTGWSIGGLVGSNEGTVTQCYSMGAVSGKSNVGGLVGGNWWGGTVTQCYSTGAVRGTGHPVGGLVGEAENSPVNTSFWDIQTSGQTTSAGGTGRTTAQMQTAKTFLDAGWDFVGETKNGTEDIWWILEGKDYPRLWWEAQN